MKTKIYPALFLSALFLFSCGTSNQEKTIQQEVVIVGGDKDDHGCKASAGYTWSSFKNECIRVFEVADAKLFSMGDETVFMGIVFNADKSKVEVFAPDKDPFVLNKKGKVWANGTYELRSKNGYQFIENEKVTYQSK